MCTVLLPPGVNPIAVDKISYPVSSLFLLICRNAKLGFYFSSPLPDFNL
jgi:hypothetical protein